MSTTGSKSIWLLGKNFATKSKTTWDSAKETGRTVGESLTRELEKRGEPTGETTRLQEQNVQGMKTADLKREMIGELTPVSICSPRTQRQIM